MSAVRFRPGPLHPPGVGVVWAIKGVVDSVSGHHFIQCRHSVSTQCDCRFIPSLGTISYNAATVCRRSATAGFRLGTFQCVAQCDCRFIPSLGTISTMPPRCRRSATAVHSVSGTFHTMPPQGRSATAGSFRLWAPFHTMPPQCVDAVRLPVHSVSGHHFIQCRHSVSTQCDCRFIPSLGTISYNAATVCRRSATAGSFRLWAPFHTMPPQCVDAVRLPVHSVSGHHLILSLLPSYPALLSSQKKRRSNRCYIAKVELGLQRRTSAR